MRDLKDGVTVLAETGSNLFASTFVGGVDRMVRFRRTGFGACSCVEFGVSLGLEDPDTPPMFHRNLTEGFDVGHSEQRERLNSPSNTTWLRLPDRIT